MNNSAIICDLGDVLFHWSAKVVTVLPPQTLRPIMLSRFWNDLQRGVLDECEAFEAIGTELSLPPASIREALAQAKTTLTVDCDLIAILQQVKDIYRVKVYAMSNIAKNDFAFLNTVMSDWTVFDGIFTSFECGMRKPERAFYRKVLDETKADPAKTIFVDDKIDNVIVARSFGMNGIIFQSRSLLLRKLHNLFGDPIARGKQYLQRNAGKHHSEIEDGTPIHDSFSQFLILEATNDDSLIVLPDHAEAQTWNYFIGPPIGTTASFPDDVDTTSCSLLALSPPIDSANSVLDTMLANSNGDNLIQTYFDQSRPRVDPIVCTNVVRAFYKYGRGTDVSSTFDFVRQTLLNRGYIDGTLHYYSPETFLFFVSRLLLENPSAPEIQALRIPLSRRLRERVGRHDDDPLALAMRLLACQAVGVQTTSDVEYLKDLQDADGGWDVGWVCRFGRSRARIGNRGLTTAYAVKALDGANGEMNGE